MRITFYAFIQKIIMKSQYELLCSVLEIELTTWQIAFPHSWDFPKPPRALLFFAHHLWTLTLLQSPWLFFNSYSAASSLCLSTLHKFLFHSEGALLPDFPWLLRPWYLSLKMISLRELGFSIWIWSSPANFFHRILVAFFTALIFSFYSCMFVSFSSAGIIDLIYGIRFLTPTIVSGTVWYILDSQKYLLKKLTNKQCYRICYIHCGIRALNFTCWWRVWYLNSTSSLSADLESHSEIIQKLIWKLRESIVKMVSLKQS